MKFKTCVANYIESLCCKKLIFVDLLDKHNIKLTISSEKCSSLSIQKINFFLKYKATQTHAHYVKCIFRAYFSNVKMFKFTYFSRLKLIIKKSMRESVIKIKRIEKLSLDRTTFLFHTIF